MHSTALQVGTREVPAREPDKKLKGHTGNVWGVIPLPCGQRIITCADDGSLRLWNLTNGLQIGKDWRDGNSSLKAIALSPDGKTVACGNEDGEVRLWDIETEKIIATWTGHSDIVWSVCWSQDGERVTSGSADGIARVRDVKIGETILGPIDTRHRILFALIYSPDETMIATGGGDNLIKIWDSKTFELVRTLKGHTNIVLCLTWTMGGKILISGSHDQSVRIWTTTTWKQSAVLTEHKGSTAATAISPNGCILATASYDFTVRLWTFENRLPIGLPLQHASDVTRISFSADGGSLATCCVDGDVYTWDVSAIVKEDGFDNPLLDSNPLQDQARKPSRDIHAMRHLSRPLNTTGRLPQGFFDDTGSRIHSSSTRLRPRFSARQSSASRPRAVLDRLSSLFHRSHPAVCETTAHGTPKPFRPHNKVHTIFPQSLLQRHQPDTELRDRQPPEVEVPYTRGLARNVRVKRKSEKKVPAPKNIMNIHVTGASQPPDTSAVQQSGVAAQDQQSSTQQQGLLATTPVTASATAANVSSTGTPLHPDIVIRQPGYWTRVWLFIGCLSTGNAANSP